MTETASVALPRSKGRKALSTTGWVFFFLFCLALFTLFGLPQTRIKSFIQGSINNALAQQGITLSAAEASLSFLFGISYTMKDVTLAFPPPKPPARLDRVEVSPSILPLLIGKLSAKVRVDQGDGFLKAWISSRKGTGSAALQLKDFDLGKSGLLGAAAGVGGTAVISGKAELEGDPSAPSSADGNVNFEIKKLSLDAQSIQGFAVPKLNVSGGTVELEIAKGKATIKRLQLGKVGSPTDDIAVSATGSISLAKQLDGSTLDLRVHFSLSQAVTKAFVLVDAILGSAKRSDGTYGYKITGPAYSPSTVPDTGG